MQQDLWTMNIAFILITDGDVTNGWKNDNFEVVDSDGNTATEKVATTSDFVLVSTMKMEPIKNSFNCLSLCFACRTSLDKAHSTVFWQYNSSFHRDVTFEVIRYKDDEILEKKKKYCRWRVSLLSKSKRKMHRLFILSFHSTHQLPKIRQMQQLIAKRKHRFAVNFNWKKSRVGRAVEDFRAHIAW